MNLSHASFSRRPSSALGASSGRRPTIAFLTDSAHPTLTADDLLLTPALEQAGFHVTPVVWTDYHGTWREFDHVVFRSTWDYYTNLDLFLRFVALLRASHPCIWNAPKWIRWNVDKRYLEELGHAGVPIVPFDVVTSVGAYELLLPRLARSSFDSFVVKPVVSAGAFQTRRVARKDLAKVSERLALDLGHSPFLVQPFIPELVSDGEWSFIFLGGEFSHACRKHPAPGDFRVQESFGGRLAPVDPTDSAIADAKAVVDLVPDHLLYARVDGVFLGGKFHLLELELIEPSLYLSTHANAPANFARALGRLITESESAKSADVTEEVARTRKRPLGR